MNRKSGLQFIKQHLALDQSVRDVALSLSTEIGKAQNIAIGNVKVFLLRTYLGVFSGYL